MTNSNRDNVQDSDLFGGEIRVLTLYRNLGPFESVVVECGSWWEDHGSLVRPCIGAYIMSWEPIRPIEYCNNALATYLRSIRVK